MTMMSTKATNCLMNTAKNMRLWLSASHVDDGVIIGHIDDTGLEDLTLKKGE